MATRVALVVGTILIAINHGPAMLAGSLSPSSYWQMGLTYLVPYAVSTYSSVSTLKQQRS